MNVNLVLSILFLVMIEICFGLNFNNTQLCFSSFCFGYYLEKRRPPQVYGELNDNKPNAKLRNFKRFFFGERLNNRERISTKARN